MMKKYLVKSLALLMAILLAVPPVGVLAEEPETEPVSTEIFVEETAGETPAAAEPAPEEPVTEEFVAEEPEEEESESEPEIESEIESETEIESEPEEPAVSLLGEVEEDVSLLATTASGTCGTNLTWTLDDAGTLPWEAAGSGSTTSVTLDVSGIESAHPYANNANQSWELSYPGASSITLTFDSQTAFESNYDKLHVYDETGAEVGTYSGTALAGQTITVEGGSVKLTLTSDGSVTKWGFKVTEAVAHMGGSDSGEEEPDGYEPATLNNGYYEIANASQLYWFAEYVNAGNTSANGRLVADITVNTGTVISNDSSVENTTYQRWTPIALGTVYSGIFDGNDHTISGLYGYCGNYTQAQERGNFSGLFYDVSGTVKDLTIDNSFFYHYNMAGGICHFNSGTIQNCSVTAYVSSNGSYHGGVAYQNKESGRIENCEFRGRWSNNGICYTNLGTISGCSNYANSVRAGICVSNYEGGTVSDCVNYGLVSGHDNSVGGICAGNSGIVSDCTNTAEVNGISMDTGGICGSNSGTIRRCANTASVSSSSTYTGGICGNNRGGEPGEGIIKSCYNTGSVHSGNVYRGGIAGSNTGLVTGCYNDGSVTSGTDAGSICGHNDARFMWGGSDGKTKLYDMTGMVTNCISYYGSTLIGTSVSGSVSANNYTTSSLYGMSPAYLMNGSTSAGEVDWYQNIDNGQTADTRPVLDDTHGKVYRITSGYTNTPQASEKSGNCGTFLDWTLDEDGTLTITGSSSMDDFGPGGAPWYPWRDEIRSVKVEGTMDSVGEYAFYNCRNLKRVDLGNRVSAIGGRSFALCTGLEEFYYGVYFSGSASIETFAFYGCTDLETISVPVSLTVASYAFKDCTALDSIYIDKYVSYPDITANMYAFSGVDATVYYPQGMRQPSVTSDHGGTLQFQQVAYGTCGMDTQWAFDAASGTLTLSGTGWPQEHSAGHFLPWGGSMNSITSVVVEEGITGIPSYTFEYLEKAETITLPDTLKTLTYNAFNDCVSLNNLLIPASVTSMGNDLGFIRCSALTDVYYLGTAEKWAQVEHSDSFNSNIRLHCLTLQNDNAPTCTEPGTESYYAFDDKTIYSAKYDENGQVVTQLAPLPAIGHSWTPATAQTPKTCVNCGETEGEPLAVCGDNLTWNFNAETGILKISGTGAMYDFAAESAPWIAYYQDIETVVIADGVTTIGSNAFDSLGAMIVVILPEGITSIGTRAFIHCQSLTAIHLPDSVTVIENDAFNDCTALTEVAFNGSAPTIGESAFYGVTATAYYPYGDATWTEAKRDNYGGTLTWKTSAPETFPGAGSGTEAEPYQVDSPETLDAVRYFKDACFLQTEDIDMTGVDWTPIPAFSGTYDGGDHKITGLTAAVTVERSTCFGGLMNQATGAIRNVHLENASVTVTTQTDVFDGTVQVGGIVGRAITYNGYGSASVSEYGTISDCSVSGTVELTTACRGHNYVGGIVGEAYTVTDCVNRAAVTMNGSELSNPNYIGAGQYVGGVVGLAKTAVARCANLGDVTVNSAGDFCLKYLVGGVVGQASVTESYNRGAVTLTCDYYDSYAGGICGIGTVENCYNAGAVTCTVTDRHSGYAGGVSGSGTVKNCYNAGSISVTGGGEYTTVGGVCGRSSATLMNCWYLNTTTATTVDTATALTAEEMWDPDSFTGFDFSEIWCYGTEADYRYPVLRAFGDVGHVFVTYTYNNDATCTEDGTETAVCAVCGTETDTRPAPGSALGHTEVVDEAKAPTCGETGLTAGSHCGVCGEPIVAQEIVPATGSHSYVVDAAVAPTCTETGLTKGSHCDSCGKVFIPQEVVPFTGHTEVEDAPVPPTCTATGLTAGSHCDVCGEPIVVQEIIPVIDHTEVVDEAVESTCSETGLTAGSHCGVCGTTLVDQQVVPKKDHIPAFTDPKAPTCTEEGFADDGMYCSVCGEVLLAPTPIPSTGHTEVVDEAKAPTCGETGLTVGSHCGVCGTTIAAQETVPATGEHDWAPATLQAPKTCTVCGATEGEPLSGNFTAGSGTAEDPYQIETKLQLDNVRNYLTRHFVLVNDIEFTEEDFAPGGLFYNDGKGWMPIGWDGTKTQLFTGSLDGQGHTISGLRSHQTGTTNMVGLFGWLSTGAVVKNLTLSDFDISLTDLDKFGYVGALAGSCDAYRAISNVTVTDSRIQGATVSNMPLVVGGITGCASGSHNYESSINNCTVTDSVTVSGTSTNYPLHIGGIVGLTDTTAIRDCASAAAVQAEAAYDVEVGGIAGIVDGISQTDRCTYSGTLTCTVKGTASGRVGGIVGHSADQVYACVNTGSVTLNSSSSNSQNVGGIMGYGGGNFNIAACINKGAVTSNAASGYTGGIAGEYSPINTGIYDCRNEGEISAVVNAAGIAGSLDEGYISGCRNNGRVYASNGSAAGIAASYSASDGKLTACANFGEVVADGGNAAGIAASLSGTIDGCYNAGSVKQTNGSYAAAGIAAYSSGTIRFSYNVGMVTRGGNPGAAITPNSTTQNGWYFLDNLPSAFSNTVDTTGQRTHEQMQQAATFVGYNFTSFWDIEPLSGYPYPQYRYLMPALTGVELVNPPQTPIRWISGEELDLTGLQGVASFDDGSTNVFNLTADLFPDLDPTVSGVQTVHISYKGLTSEKALTVEIHVHAYTDTVTAPTCKDQGYTTHACPCGDSYVDSYVDALGHEYANGVCIHCGTAEPVPSGTCGEVTWILRDDVLILTPTDGEEGTMARYASAAKYPWSKYADDIAEIEVQEGVLNVSDFAFAELSHLESVFLSETVEEIGRGVFTDSGRGLEITICNPDCEIFEGDDGETLSGDAWIFGYTGSTAEEYAEEHDCDFCGESNRNSTPGHDTVTTLVEATCVEGEHTLTYCDNGCGYEKKGKYRTDPSGIHSFDDQSICTVCGFHGTQDEDGTVTPIRSGRCGENLYWALSEDNTTLTISGTGAMWDYEPVTYLFVNDKEAVDERESSNAPWNYYAFEIETLVLPEGMTTVGSYAFRGLEGVTALTLPESLTAIGARAFSKFSDHDAPIENLTIPAGVTELGDGAFADSGFTGTLTVSGPVEELPFKAFAGCHFDEVVLAEGVAVLRERALAFCDMEGEDMTSITIHLPLSLQQIDRWAIDGYESGEALTLSYAGCEPLWNALVESGVIDDRMTARDVNVVTGDHRFTDYAPNSDGLTETAFCDFGCGETDTREIPAVPDPIEDVLATYVEDNRLVLLQNVPEELTVILAVYDEGRMVYSTLRSDAPANTSFLLPEDLEFTELRAFFLSEDYALVGKALSI